MNIKNQNITIRFFKEADLLGFASYRNDPQVAKYQSWSDFSLQDAIALYKKINSVPFGTVGHWFQLAIEDNVQKKIIGDLALHFVDDDQIELGFTVSAENQKKGVALKSITSVLSFIFHDLKKHRVYAITDTQNIACYTLLEKIGFRREAHHIENIYFKGEWGSEYIYAMLNSEW